MFEKFKNYSLLEIENTDETLEKLLSNVFIFSGKYDMERCDFPIENKELNWDLNPFGDPEWTFVLNRMDYCIPLIVKTIKTGQVKYANKAKSLIRDWIDQNTEKSHHKEIRTLDTGIRITVWCQCIELLEYLDYLETQEKKLITESIEWQARYICENTQNFQQFSNWGMMQSIGLMNALMYIEIDENDKWIDFYNQHLELQFFKDGMHHEQSSIYIMEVLVRLLQLKNKKFKNEKYYEVLLNGGYALIALTNVNDKSIALGDGDEVDTIGILQMIAYETKNEYISSFVKHKKIREETYFLYGDKLVTYFDSCKTSKFETKYLKFPYSGHLVIRDDNNYFSIHNGTVGGTHGHFDNLHINYSTAGNKILSDNGRYTYVVGSEEREKLKSHIGHNVIIPYESNIRTKDVWRNEGLHKYTNIEHQSEDGIDFVITSYNLSGDKWAQRMIFRLPTNELIICDYFEDRYFVNFNLDYEASFDSSNYIINNEIVFRPLLFDKSKVSKIEVSPIYNQLKESTSIKVYPSEEITINSFIRKDSKIELFKNFENLHYDRLYPYEKKYKMVEYKRKDMHYVIGVKMIEGANCDNCVKVYDKYIFGTAFVYDILKEKVSIFKQ